MLLGGNLKKSVERFSSFLHAVLTFYNFRYWPLILCKLIFFCVVFSKIKQSVSTQIVLNFVTYLFTLEIWVTSWPGFKRHEFLSFAYFFKHFSAWLNPLTFQSLSWRNVMLLLCWPFNPLSPKIHMQILQTDLYTFP